MLEKKWMHQGIFALLLACVVSSASAAPTTVFSETWESATEQSFTGVTAASLTADNTWTINSSGANVLEVFTSAAPFPPFASKVFGKKLLAGSDLQTQTAPLTAAIDSGDVVTIKAKTGFNLTGTAGQSDGRVNVSNAAQTTFYRVSVNTKSDTATPFSIQMQGALGTTSLFNAGTIGNQDTTSVWDITATFTRVSDTSTHLDYTILKSGAAYVSGTYDFPDGLTAGTGVLTDCQMTFRTRGAVSFDDILITKEAPASGVEDWQMVP